LPLQKAGRYVEKFCMREVLRCRGTTVRTYRRLEGLEHVSDAAAQ
jgi:hypothetical protein